MTAIWDERLITRERAANMCGSYPVKVDSNTFLRCWKCDGNITLLVGGRMLNVDQIIGVVLRHMCSSHDYKLSGAGNEDEGNNAAADDSAGSRGGGGLAGDPGR